MSASKSADAKKIYISEPGRASGAARTRLKALGAWLFRSLSHFIFPFFAAAAASFFISHITFHIAIARTPRPPNTHEQSSQFQSRCNRFSSISPFSNPNSIAIRNFGIRQLIANYTNTQIEKRHELDSDLDLNIGAPISGEARGVGASVCAR